MAGKLEDRVREIIVDQLGVNAEQVTTEASFIDDLGADSLDSVELIMAFEEEFGAAIPEEDRGSWCCIDASPFYGADGEKYMVFTREMDTDDGVVITETAVNSTAWGIRMIDWQTPDYSTLTRLTCVGYLTTDKTEVDKYVADKYCGFLFTAAGYRDLFTILNKVSGKDWYDSIYEKLPVLLVSGEDDPVGTYGKGIKQIYNDLIAAGKKDVTIKLFPGMRHEILNETNRSQVYEYITSWSLSKIK